MLKTSDKVLVTGSTGFLGRNVVRMLKATGYSDIVETSDYAYDLINPAACREMFDVHEPVAVIDCAARVGGIKANHTYPAMFLYDNAIMGLHMLEEASHHNVKKFIQISSACAYPEYADIPTPEGRMWGGRPEVTNRAYGEAKRFLLSAADAYRKQYGLNITSIIPTNMYGPEDNFNSETSHVIPSLIRKIDDAHNCGWEEVYVWGTGEATRDFLYVEDAADAIVRALCVSDLPRVNIGTGYGISIRALAIEIARLSGYKGKFIFEPNKPDGQLNRALYSVLAEESLSWVPKTDLIDGLSATIAWWKKEGRYQHGS